MKPLKQLFAERIYEDLVEINLSIHQHLCDEVNLTSINSSMARQNIEFIRNMNPNQRQIFYNHARRITIDALSSLLAIIDDAMPLEDFPTGSFELRFGSHIKTNLSGSLRDLFWQAAERHEGVQPDGQSFTTQSSKRS